MKFFVIAFAVIAAASAASIATDYLPPVDNNLEATEVVVNEAPAEQGVLADDGYRYKTVRRLKFRHRRDVSELPSNDYLPPAAEEASQSIAVEVPAEQGAELADDGYRYKTVRRLRYRHRRDVSELPSNDYLPPAIEEASQSIAVEVPAEQGAELAADGYRYKTVRRLRYRHRRDVSELPSNDYLPPAVEEASQSIAVEVPAEQGAELADDGYRYKTVRRLRYRHRRDVSELPSNDYLPPAVEEASQSIAVEVPAEQGAELADDGYRYKTVRRLRYRHRRDVSELPSNDYLPPAVEEASQSIAVEVPAEQGAELADDGYRYKTVRRLRYRHRRDVSELPSNDYLPPAIEEASQSIAVEVPAEQGAELAADGYRYKTVRRLRYRHRRDVSELPSNDYLPPAVEEASQSIAVEVPAEQGAELAADGYRYKTVRRLRYRHRRDVNELSSEYLPPVEEAAASHVIDVPVQQQETVLADDGYRYKTVRRLKYRRH